MVVLWWMAVGRLFSPSQNKDNSLMHKKRSASFLTCVVSFYLSICISCFVTCYHSLPVSLLLHAYSLSLSIYLSYFLSYSLCFSDSLSCSILEFLSLSLYHISVIPLSLYLSPCTTFEKKLVSGDTG